MGAIFSGLFSAATSALSGIYGYLAVAGVCLILGATGTWRVMSWHEQAAVASQAVAAVKLAQKQNTVTFTVEKTAAAEVQKIADNSATIKRSIPVHVTQKADAACPVTAGFNSVFNAAAANTTPASDAGNDDAASDVTLSAIAEVTADNDQTYYTVAARLKEWQDWYVKQQQVPQ